MKNRPEMIPYFLNLFKKHEDKIYEEYDGFQKLDISNDISDTTTSKINDNSFISNK